MRTVLMAHFHTVYVKEGQQLKKGDAIGLMGTTGYSFGEHVHLAVSNQKLDKIWKMASSVQYGVSKYLIDEFLNEGKIFKVGSTLLNNKITAGYLDPAYSQRHKTAHYAYDLIGDKAMKIPDVVWPSNKVGTVVRVSYQHNGAGNYVLIQYDEKYGNKIETQKTTAELMAEVLEGKHGNGVERVKNLGKRYREVQDLINKFLKAKTIKDLADMVLAGKLGNGNVRKRILKDKYLDVQVEVTRMLKGEIEYYKVKKGDSWWSIAQDVYKDGTKMYELAAYNKKSILDTLHPNDFLKIKR